MGSEIMTKIGCQPGVTKDLPLFTYSLVLNTVSESLLFSVEKYCNRRIIITDVKIGTDCFLSSSLFITTYLYLDLIHDVSTLGNKRHSVTS